LPFVKLLNPPSSPFSKGGKVEFFIECIQKISPPFGKGRLGGISEEGMFKKLN
jgi:hypothetical protein